MNTQQHARQFAAEAHACAMQMMENAGVTNGTASDLVLMLVMESATNIMNAVPTLPDIENTAEAESEHDDRLGL